MPDERWYARTQFVDLFNLPPVGIVGAWLITTIQIDDDDNEIFVSEPELFHCVYQIPADLLPSWLEMMREKWLT